MNMREFLEYIVKNLVDNPNDVKVNEIGGSQTTILELSLNKDDTGKVIGRGGRTIQSLRTLLSSIASRHNTRVKLEIIEQPQEQEAGAEEGSE
jgi:uncharacterized protein